MFFRLAGVSALAIVLAGCVAAEASDQFDENAAYANEIGTMTDDMVAIDERSPSEVIADKVEMTADRPLSNDGWLRNVLGKDAPPAASTERRVKFTEPTPRRDVFQVLEGGLRTFKGKPQQFAFSKLGYPDSKMIIGGDTVYRWENSTPARDGGQLNCVVKVIARAGRIITTDFNGNAGACNQYATIFGLTNIR